jgi:hypothetical protein
VLALVKEPLEIQIFVENDKKKRRATKGAEQKLAPELRFGVYPMVLDGLFIMAAAEKQRFCWLSCFRRKYSVQRISSTFSPVSPWFQQLP